MNPVVIDASAGVELAADTLRGRACASAASVLNDLADQVAAAADLDDAARRDVDFDLAVGDPEFAISDALLATRTPLPTPLFKRIREGVDMGWYQDATPRLVLDALDRQEGQNVA